MKKVVKGKEIDREKVLDYWRKNLVGSSVIRQQTFIKIHPDIVPEKELSQEEIHKLPKEIRRVYVERDPGKRKCHICNY